MRHNPTLRRIATAGSLAAIAATLAILGVRAVALELLGIDPLFRPIASPQPLLATAIAGIGATIALAPLARVAGCTTIIAIDVHKNCVDLAKSVGATHTIHGRAENAKDEIMRITGGKGVDYILDTTANPDALVHLAEALAVRGTIMLVGAAAPGTRAPFEVGGSLTKGWTFKTVVQGGSVPQVFIPHLVELWPRRSLSG